MHRIYLLVLATYIGESSASPGNNVKYPRREAQAVDNNTAMQNREKPAASDVVAKTIMDSVMNPDYEHFDSSSSVEYSTIETTLSDKDGVAVGNDPHPASDILPSPAVDSYEEPANRTDREADDSMEDNSGVILSGDKAEVLFENAKKICEESTVQIVKEERLRNLLIATEAGICVSTDTEAIVKWIELLVKNKAYRNLLSLRNAIRPSSGKIEIPAADLKRVIALHTACSTKEIDTYYLIATVKASDYDTMGDNDAYDLISAFMVEGAQGKEFHPSIEKGMALVNTSNVSYSTAKRIIDLFAHSTEGQASNLFSTLRIAYGDKQESLVDAIIETKNVGLITEMYDKANLLPNFKRDSAILRRIAEEGVDFNVHRLFRIFCKRGITNRSNLIEYADLLEDIAVPTAAIHIPDFYAQEPTSDINK